MELLEIIKDAFPTVPLPSMSLHQGQLADESIRREISEDEWRRAADEDKDQTWPMLSDAAHWDKGAIERDYSNPR
jgi:hypothetical protein